MKSNWTSVKEKTEKKYAKKIEGKEINGETKRVGPEFIIIVVIPNNILLIYCHIKRNSIKVLCNKFNEYQIKDVQKFT